MNAIGRRAFIAGATMAPLIPACAGLAMAQAPVSGGIALFDGTLDAGRRFATRTALLGGRAISLEGDRVRLIGRLLAARPASLYGLTRFSDSLLIGDIAGEAGYRLLAMIRHGRDGALVTQCLAGDLAIARIASACGGACWPEAFAELALGQSHHMLSRTPRDPDHAAFSWILQKQS